MIIDGSPGCAGQRDAQRVEAHSDRSHIGLEPEAAEGSLKLGCCRSVRLREVGGWWDALASQLLLCDNFGLKTAARSAFV